MCRAVTGCRFPGTRMPQRASRKHSSHHPVDYTVHNVTTGKIYSVEIRWQRGVIGCPRAVMCRAVMVCLHMGTPLPQRASRKHSSHHPVDYTVHNVTTGKIYSVEIRWQRGVIGCPRPVMCRAVMACLHMGTPMPQRASLRGHPISIAHTTL